MDKLLDVFKGMPVKGTRIVVFNLKTIGELLPDHQSQPADIQSITSPLFTPSKRSTSTPAPNNPVYVDLDLDGSSVHKKNNTTNNHNNNKSHEEEEEEEDKASDEEDKTEKEAEEEEGEEGDGGGLDSYMLISGTGIEFDLSVRGDIQLVESVRETSPFFGGKNQDAPLLYSLRAYMAILYNQPRMQVIEKKNFFFLKK